MARLSECWAVKQLTEVTAFCLSAFLYKILSCGEGFFLRHYEALLDENNSDLIIPAEVLQYLLNLLTEENYLGKF